MNYLNYSHDENYNYELHGNGVLTKDIEYNSLSKMNTLDLYIPTVQKEKYPIVIYIHGGGFQKGDKTHHLMGILHVLEKGYAVAAINYRTGLIEPYPAFLEDCCDGIKFLKKNAADYHLDKDKIILWGDTHGAYIASRIAIDGPKGLLDDLVSEFPQETLDVNGVVSFYGPMDLYNFHLLKDFKADIKTFNMEEKDLLEFLKFLNPIDNIDGSECPFYLLHGKLDLEIPQTCTYKFADTLKKYNVPHVLDMVEDGIHSIDFYAQEKYNVPILKFIEDVFDKNLNSY